MEPKDFSAVTGRLQDAIDDAAAEASGASNLIVLQNQIDAIARGDFAACLAQALPDVVLSIFAPPEFPFVRQARGIDELQQALEHNFSALDDQRPVIVDLFTEGATIVMFGRETGRIRATGTSYHVEFVERFTFKHGRLAEVRIIAAHTARIPD